jgi:hypothetical protein
LIELVAVEGLASRHADYELYGVGNRRVSPNAAITGAWKDSSGSPFSGSAIENGMSITFDDVEFDTSTPAYKLRK